MFTRQDIEGMKAMDRPTVRCKVDCDYVDEDGIVTRISRNVAGRIIIDGNNPWVEIWVAGKHIAERFSWELVLEVINRPHEPPIHFWANPVYRV